MQNDVANGPPCGPTLTGGIWTDLKGAGQFKTQKVG
jgi:hypothetical protein